MPSVNVDTDVRGRMVAQSAITCQKAFTGSRLLCSSEHAGQACHEEQCRRERTSDPSQHPRSTLCTGQPSSELPCNLECNTLNTAAQPTARDP